MNRNYNADVRKFDGDGLVACSKCGTFLSLLRQYEISKSEAPGVGAELWQFMLFGWVIFVYNFVFDFFTFESRKSELARLK